MRPALALHLRISQRLQGTEDTRLGSLDRGHCTPSAHLLQPYVEFSIARREGPDLSMLSAVYYYAVTNFGNTSLLEQTTP
jgi:hypothetical protein